MGQVIQKHRSVLTLLIVFLFFSLFLFYKTTPKTFADALCNGKNAGDVCRIWYGDNTCCDISETNVCNTRNWQLCEWIINDAGNDELACYGYGGEPSVEFHDPCLKPECNPCETCGTCPPPPTPPPPTPTPTPTEVPGCPPINCTYSQPNGGCPTGVEIVTGTNIYGGCTYAGEDCSTAACEAPGLTPTPTPGGGCNNNGDMDNGETGIDCGGGGCPPCPPTPDVPEAVCQEGVSDGTWSDNPKDWPKTVTRAPGEGVAFKVRLTATKGSMNEFYLENKFDNIIDGFTNIWQNTDRDRSGLGIWQGYPPYLYSSTFPGLSFTSDWSDYGNFNTGQKDEFEWNETLTSTAQSFKNTMFFKYDNPGVPPAAFKGRYDNRCWLPLPEEAPDSEDCIVFPIGCGGDWATCPYSLYFNCNKVTVEVSLVRASITGSTNVLVGSPGSWDERYEGNAQSGSISITRKDRQSFSCTAPNSSAITDSGDPNRRRYWCVLDGAGTSTPFSRSWTPQNVSDAGDYWAVANAFANATGRYTGNPREECSGNPDCTFNGIPGDPSTGWRNCAGWSDCGPPPSPNDRIDFTVTYPPPRASISGPATATVNQNLDYEGRLEGTARSGWITVTRDDKGVFTCPSGLVVDSTGRNWCFLAIGVSTPFSGSFTPREAGVYWVLVNAFVDQKAEYVGKPGDECTGNPDCTFNGGWRDCSYGWSNCGDSDNIRLTVSATCQISGVTCGAVTPSTVTLNNISWTDSGWGATGMVVQRDAFNIFNVPFASSFTDSGLAPNTTNNYYVGCYKDLGGGATAYTGWTGPVACATPSLPPTCSSVSLSPNPMALFVEQATGRTLTPTVNGLSNGTISNVSYSSSNTLVATVNPSFSTIFPFETTVGTPGTRASTTVATTANLSGAGGTGSCTGASTVSVGGCSVSLSASSVTNPDPVTVRFTGRSPNSGSEPVRLWLKSKDGREIWPGTGVNDVMLDDSCNSVNGSPCDESVVLQDLPAGDYYVHCDIPNEPNRCTGNPWGLDPGWESCSTNDSAALAVIDPAPTCTGVTLLPDPMPLFPEQVSGRILTPTVSDIRYGRVSSVDYSSSDPGVAGVSPASSTVSPFQTRVGTPGLRGSPTVTATANLIGGAGLTGSCTGTSTVSVGGCDVSLSASSVVYPNSVTVDYSGRSPNSGSEPVRLWLKSQDRGEIWPGTGVNDVMLDDCDSVNGSLCDKSDLLLQDLLRDLGRPDLPAGDYYVHCDIPNDPDKCTGNPFCIGACANEWESCSTDDNAALTVLGMPTCNVNGPETVYLDETAEYNGSATVQGANSSADGAANLVIGRNTSKSINPPYQELKRNNCGDSLTTCAIPPADPASWTPLAAEMGTNYVFCRGYNVTLDPDLECRPFGPYSYPVVGDCSWPPDSNPDACGASGTDCISVQVEPPPSWFQTAGGDVHAEGRINSRVSPQASPPYFSLNSPFPNGYPGVVSARSTGTDFDPSLVSEDPPFGWLLDEYSYDGLDYFNRKPYGYEYFDKKIINPQLNPPGNPQSWDGNKKITEGDLIINQEWLVNGNKQVVVLVENNLIINKNITIQQTPGVERNFVAFIVRGNIIIDGSVSVDNLTNPPALEGVYIADGQIRTGSTGPSDKQLYAKGAFIAWEGFALERTFQSTDEPFEPAERFEHDINLLMQAPSALLSAPVVWQEIAP